MPRRAPTPTPPLSPTPSPLPPPPLKEIGNLASWTVSTAKPGNGIAQLRDDDTNLFWQSDGPQPHHINIHFARRVRIARMRIYLDFDADESYTPTRLAVWAGTGANDLEEVVALELERPVGWVEVPVGEATAGGRSGEGEGGEGEGGREGGREGEGEGELRCRLLQVRVLANHQNGKDTHVRGLQVFARERERGEQGELVFTSGRMLDELELR